MAQGRGLLREKLLRPWVVKALLLAVRVTAVSPATGKPCALGGERRGAKNSGGVRGEDAESGREGKERGGWWCLCWVLSLRIEVRVGDRGHRQMPKINTPKASHSASAASMKSTAQLSTCPPPRCPGSLEAATQADSEGWF